MSASNGAPRVNLFGMSGVNGTPVSASFKATSHSLCSVWTSEFSNGLGFEPTGPALRRRLGSVDPSLTKVAAFTRYAGTSG